MLNAVPGYKNETLKITNMEKKILELKKLNAALMAAQEWDYCPEPKKLKEVVELFDVGVSDKELKDALRDNSGRRSDEIVNSISDLIKEL